MLRSGVIYDSLFRFKNINLNSVNNIYFAIDIIIIIATTFLETLIIAIFVFKLDIIIIVNVDIIIIIVFEEFVIKLIAFDFDIKKRFIMNALLNKS